MHEKSVIATARTINAAPSAAADAAIVLASPLPGLFRIALKVGDVVRPGTVLGELEVLGQLIAVVAPPTASGAVTAICGAHARPAVDHGAMLVTLDPHASAAPGAVTAAAATTSTTGLVFRAPTSGRFYGRPGPDKPAFLTAGAELVPGTTVCLLEVMKTFHRVTYGGTGLPERARVRDVLVADGDDVNAGDALLALDPA
ncbi:MAG: hypothetical protein M3619_27050 [Myxococcota bacterium]|nr:hypothetical protein [Myxococcota bacterium]